MTPAAHPPAPGALRLLGRALRLRCPQCGGGRVMLGWTTVLPGCDRCGLGFTRGERGYWLGAYFLNLVAIEVVFTAWWGAVLALTWPDLPWTFLNVSTFVLMLGTPVLFHPFAHTLWLACDLLVRPAGDDDFRAPQEPPRVVRGSPRAPRA